MDWNSIKRPDGTINLVKAYEMKTESKAPEVTKLVLEGAEDMQPIRSRQVATSIIVQAINMEFILDAIEALDRRTR